MKEEEEGFWELEVAGRGSRQICKEEEGFELVVGAADEFASRRVLFEEGVQGMFFLCGFECCRH